jgi:ribonuclease HI
MTTKCPCTYTLFFDGCSKGNPGPSGIGAVIYQLDENSDLINKNTNSFVELWAGSKFLSNSATNNQSEYNALIMGLTKALELNISLLDVYGDSLLVIQQTNGKYKVSNAGLLPLHQKVMELKKQFQNITFTHIPREKNVRADYLSNVGLKECLQMS